MEPVVIEVHGVPHIPPQDRMVDQLKIHFLKRRNSGGDVLTVIYPTSTPGQAYVIFESDKVPGVLECSHILDVNNRFYPIHVKKAHLSEVDMQVEATLDLSTFPKRDPVLNLIKSYDFRVTEHLPGHLQVKGSFLKLKLIRNQLVQLQGHGRHYSRSASALHNGSSLGYELERNNTDPRFVSKSVLRDTDKMDAAGQRQLLESTASSSSYRVSGSGGSPRSHQSSRLSYTEKNSASPEEAVDHKYDREDRIEAFVQRRTVSKKATSSISANDPSSVTMLQHTPPLYRESASGGVSIYYSSNGGTSHTADTMQHHASYKDSASGGSPRRRPSFSSDTWASSSHGSPSSPSSSGGMASFQEDTDIINFILLQRQNDVKMIEKGYGTEMSIIDNDGLTTVTFLGKNSEKAKTDLINIIKEIRPSLRTQEIHLQEYDLAKQKRILERTGLTRDSGVVTTLSGDVIKLVGSSSESFEMKQKLLGHKVEHPRGRTMERGSTLRRSSSLPKQYKTQHKQSTEPENAASPATIYTPSRYQENPDEGKALPMARGTELNPDRKSQRIRSHSESRGKNRTTKEKSVQDLESPGLSQGIKSPKQISARFAKFLDTNIKDIDFKMRLRKKK